MNYNQDPRRQRSGYGPLGEPEIKRTYTPEEAGHERHRKPVTRLSYNSRRRKRKKPNSGVIILVAVFVLIAAGCIFLLLSGRNTPEKPAPETDEKTGIVVETKPGETKGEPSPDGGEDKEELPYITVTLSAEDVYTGDLVLVNAYHEYHFPADMENDIVTIADHKNGHYGLSSYSTSVSMSMTMLNAFNKMTEDYYNETGFEWLQVNSAYRSLEEQETLYDQYVRDYGIEYTTKYVADPGESEHHTGLGLDLNVNRNGAISYVGDDAECAWFREKCQNYGFVLRYPGDKIDITGIGHESWHYRYVGVPHAQIMEDKNLCLEEYIDFVKAYTYGETCLGYSEETGAFDITADGYYENGGTMIYYVPATGEDVEISVPRGCEYTVSGNNVDGYIITCVK